MHDEQGHAAVSAAAFEMDGMSITDIEHAGVARLDRRAQVAVETVHNTGRECMGDAET
jgi:hypothetical protein